jgi:hypothetical protein
MFAKFSTWMRVALVVVALGRLAVPHAAAQLSGSAPLSSAGTSEKAVTEFLAKLQKAVQADDRAAVAGLVSYPLRAWNGKTVVMIKDKVQFLAQYPAVFTATLKATIATSRLENSWANNQGVMFDNGRIWLEAGTKGTLRIITVNPPSD